MFSQVPNISEEHLNVPQADAAMNRVFFHPKFFITHRLHPTRTGDIGIDRLKLKDLDLQGKRVLIHVDFDNVFHASHPTELTAPARLQMRLAVPTIQHCFDNGAKSVVLVSRLSDPSRTLFSFSCSGVQWF